MKKVMTIVMVALAFALVVSPVASKGGAVEMMRVMDPGGGR